jgi:hypothetical protein
MEKGNKIILVLGIIAFAAGFIVKSNYATFLKTAVQTEGKVVHVLGSSYQIRYFTADGAEKLVRGSGKSHGYHEGDIVKAWYPADVPDRVRFSDGRKGTRMLFGAGIFCVLMGIYPLFLKKKETPGAN